MNPKAQGSGALFPNRAESQGPQLKGAPGGSAQQCTGLSGAGWRAAAPPHAEPPARCSELRWRPLWEPRMTAFGGKMIIVIFLIVVAFS